MSADLATRKETIPSMSRPPTPIRLTIPIAYASSLIREVVGGLGDPGTFACSMYA